MKTQSLALATGVLTALAGLAPTAAFATGVCYVFNQPQNNPVSTVDGGSPIVIRYLATKVGAINTDTEARNLGHLRQDAYSLVGKVTAIITRCADAVEPGANQVCENLVPIENQSRLMTTADGTIVTGKLLAGAYSPDEPGAHMGVNIHLLRRIPEVAGPYPIGPALLECSSSYAAINPPSWRCNLRADLIFPYQFVFPIVSPITLTRVNSNSEPACSVFQDGDPYVRPTE
jgi:hypothetical protein